MSMQTETGMIPEWTRGDRLRKARTLTGMTTRAFAEQIGVSPQTVSNAENDHHNVRKIVINAWALATGVPAEWLETGKVPRPDGPDGGLEECAIRDSNPKPAAWEDTALTSSVARRTGTVSRFPVRPAAA